MSDFLEDLKRYFDTTPPEKVKANWDKGKEYDNIGPTVGEFLRNNNSIWAEQEVIYRYVRQRRQPTLFQQRRLNKVNR